MILAQASQVVLYGNSSSSSGGHGSLMVWVLAGLVMAMGAAAGLWRLLGALAVVTTTLAAVTGGVMVAFAWVIAAIGGTVALLITLLGGALGG